MMSSKKAFTLVETLVVMAIISLMIGLLAPQGEKFLENIKFILKKHEKANQFKKDKLDAFFKDTIDKKYAILKTAKEQ